MRCFAQARVKLCGRRLEGTVNAWSHSAPDGDVAIKVPAAYANSTLEVSIESIGPGEFGCERIRWWMFFIDHTCSHTNEKRSKPIDLDVPPFHWNTLLGRLRLRLREAYFPF